MASAAITAAHIAPRAQASLLLSGDKVLPLTLVERLAAIETLIESKRAELGVPGAALAIVQDDTVLMLKGFGVRDLAVKNIVIVGHSGCGGIQALRRCCAGDPMKEREFIGPWVASAARACEDVSSDADNAVVERNAIAISLENLRTFPWIDEAVTAGQLALHGWWFDFDRGQLWAFDDRTGAFAILE